MTLNGLLAWLDSTAVSTVMRESEWMFPTVETVHVLALALVVGSIMIVDLRLLNLASRSRSVSELLREMLPWTWISFVGAAITGALMFISSAVTYSQNWPFRIKVLLLLTAGINMGVFHLGAYRSVAQWDRSAAIPVNAKLAAATSLTIWVSVVTLGRWIGFT